MTAAELLFPTIGDVLVVATLSGLLARGRMRLCPAFAAYLGMCLLSNRLMLWWPENFLTRRFWMMKEAVIALLMLLILLDLMSVALAGFPRVRRLVTWAVLGLACVALLAVIASFAAGLDYPVLAAVFERARSGTVGAYVAALIVIYRYSLPQHPLQRMVLLGFVLYLGAYGAMLGARTSPVMSSALGALGHSASTYFVAIADCAYCATIALWAWAAWAPSNEPAGPRSRGQAA
jgi:hypothetical protein